MKVLILVSGDIGNGDIRKLELGSFEPSVLFLIYQATLNCKR